MEHQEDILRYYLDNYFSLPKDVIDDVVYCQRSLKNFMKVHQIVVDVYKKQTDADPVAKQRIITELEDDMTEINAEQQVLMLRITEARDDFIAHIRSHDFEFPKIYANLYISETFAPLISNMAYVITPKSVKVRPNFNELIRKHFVFSSDTTDVAGVLVPNVESANDDLEAQMDSLFPVQSDNTDDDVIAIEEPVPIVTVSDDENNLIEEVPDDEEDHIDEEGQLSENLEQVVINDDPNTDEQPEPIEVKAEDCLFEAIDQDFFEYQSSQEAAMEIPVVAAPTKSSKRSRKTKQRPRVFDDDEELFLHNLTMKLAIGPAPQPPPPPPPPEEQSFEEETQLEAIALKPQISKKLVAASPQKFLPPIKRKNIAIKKKVGLSKTASKKNRKFAGKKDANATNTSTTSSNASASSGETNAFSSDDSQLEGARQNISWNEPVDRRCFPSEYGQENFLALFELYTPTTLAHMQQRRSKRQRRNIHTTERSDFHYERFELQPPCDSKKKNKEFLLSPKVKRMRAKKASYSGTSGHSKNSTPEKNEEAPSTSTGKARGQYLKASRVGKYPSLSNDKFKCKECRKDHEPMLPCSVCDYMFHQECHEDKGKPHAHIKCPTCYSHWKTEMLKAIHKYAPSQNSKGNAGNNKRGDGDGGHQSK